MSEVEKMYSNANIKICKRKQGFTLKDCTDRDCKECGYCNMPPFTTEKQISLIMFLSYKHDKGLLINLRTVNKVIDIYDFELFGECLAKLVNELWQSLTDEEYKQIKEILE